jgi:hypothetical protein
MKELELKEIEGASRLGREFFNKIIRRIESTKPTAGTGITVMEEDNGFKISFSGSGGGSGGGTGGVTGSTVILNVCSNGEPDTIEVYVKTATTA